MLPSISYNPSHFRSEDISLDSIYDVYHNNISAVVVVVVVVVEVVNAIINLLDTKLRCDYDFRSRNDMQD